MIILYVIKDFTTELLSIFQYPILLVSFYFFRIFLKDGSGIVIGVTEISKLLYLYGKVIPSAKKVCLDENRFYDLDYDYKLKRGNKFVFLVKRFIYGPILLAYLARKSNLFIYLWSTGFLLNRKYDFIFLKSNSKKIVNIFLGDDIRSPKRLKEVLNNLEQNGFLNDFGIENPYYLSDEYDKKKKSLAELSDKYAHVCFSYPVDQASYLRSTQYPTPYIFSKESFRRSDLKFADKKLKILHAPTNSLIKGTVFVREAIEKLQNNGYDFEYNELINVPHSIVIKKLQESHIVLNQFYAFIPGMFGIESMANHCAVLMSADSTIEYVMPKSSKDAWMLTRHWEIYDNLKYLFDHRDEIKGYADRGYSFVKKNYEEEKVNLYLKKVFKENGIEF